MVGVCSERLVALKDLITAPDLGEGIFERIPINLTS